MATYFSSSIRKGSDVFFEFPCITCQGNDRNTEALFYCTECSKAYCGKCVEHHNVLYMKHAIMGKEAISKWSVTNVDASERCQEHKQELTGFCEDHKELLCHVCHVYNHQKCSHVVIIADKLKDLQQTGEYKKMSALFDSYYRLLILKKNSLEKSIQFHEKSCDKIREEINELRKKINDELDQLERNTVKELDALLTTLRASIQTDIFKCYESIKQMSRVQDDWVSIQNKSGTIHFRKYISCLDQSLRIESTLKEMEAQREMILTFYPDRSIQKTLSTLSDLGDIIGEVRESQTASKVTPDEVTKKRKPQSCNTVTSRHINALSNMNTSAGQPGQVRLLKTKYRVRVKSETNTCRISGICETGAGDLLITDWWNKNVKLLDQDYKVVARYDLPDTPLSMCSIDSNQVAVAVGNSGVLLMRVTNGCLRHKRTLNIEHSCTGIAHHHGNLYITSRDALYLYTVDGRLVSKMYENTLRRWTVTSCAVSPDGQRIYVANEETKQLFTLSSNGRVISTLSDPSLKWSYPPVLPGFHLMDSGEVLVCGDLSNTIIEVDRDGRQRLAEVISEKDEVIKPMSVYYSYNTSSYIVGMDGNDHIMVCKKCKKKK
ncbi:uncharacterized protein LOC127869030 [Dreissena polymorpha]|uniref:B box-type domain-containing protein n=1 Tax=Dreissena polymorpha TaxID=45954 RepID=A0A9D4RNF5_DREPO|nr:uncharacterized protein LOC127869030 [Dreissena polymorpha]KAH3873523.1 hypothetical protein DPMN_036760 [Dreissena polymorpha]